MTYHCHSRKCLLTSSFFLRLWRLKTWRRLTEKKKRQDLMSIFPRNLKEKNCHKLITNFSTLVIHSKIDMKFRSKTMQHLESMLNQEEDHRQFFQLPLLSEPLQSKSPTKKVLGWTCCAGVSSFNPDIVGRNQETPLPDTDCELETTVSIPKKYNRSTRHTKQH